jgi:hypothetical protein
LQLTTFGCKIFVALGSDMANSDRLLPEIRDAIASGNKVSAAFLIGAFVWWAANLLPYDFSELGVTTPAAKLETLRKASKDASQKCEKLQRDFASTYATGSDLVDGRPCHLPMPALPVLVPLSAVDKVGPDGASEIEARRNEIYYRLVTGFRTIGPAASLARIEESIQAGVRNSSCDFKRFAALAESSRLCRDSRAELTKFNEQIAKQGSLDVAGIKVPNIHPRWHPLIMVLVIALAIGWLAAIRRRTFRLIAGLLATRDGGVNEADLPPLLMSIPWWLLPELSAPAPAGALSSKVLAPKAERKRAWLSLAVITCLIGLMFFSAIHTQRLLSTFDVVDVKAIYQLQTFGLSGSVPGDLMLLAGLLALAIVDFWMSAPPCAAEVISEDAPSIARRRFAQGAVGVAFVAAFAATTSLVFARDRTVALAGKAAVKLRVPLSPRFRKRKARYLQSGAAPGWYRNPKRASNGKSTWVAHFVQPAYSFTHQRKPNVPKPRPRIRRRIKAIMKYAGLVRPTNAKKPRVPRHISRPAGRVKAALHMKVTQLVVAAPEDIATARERRDKRLNAAAYSQGIEVLALTQWKSDPERALQTLRAGLQYATSVPLNVRLYDLTAGLLVRSGRTSELVTLGHELEDYARRLRGRIESAKQRLGGVDPPSKDAGRPRRVSSSSARPSAPEQSWSEAKARGEKIRREIKRYEGELARIQMRIETWKKPNSPWAAKWASDNPRKWAGIDI